MAKRKVTEEDLINWWLTEYHDTNMNEVLASHPQWWVNPRSHHREFYLEYAVTQEQHDEWEAWAKEAVRKSYGLSKRYNDVTWPFLYLNVSPQVKDND
jgi:hypothetical protein